MRDLLAAGGLIGGSGRMFWGRGVSVFLAIACTQTAAVVGATDTGTPALDVSATISEAVHTVVIVTWRTEVETTGYVEFGRDDAYGLTTNATPAGTEHRALLLGTPAETDVHYRVVVDDGTTVTSTENAVITTLSLPPGTPDFTTSGSVDGRWQYQVVPTQGTTAVVAVLDGNGDVVWYYTPPEGGNLMKAILSHDREWIILGHAGPQNRLEESRIDWVSLDGLTVETLDMPEFDHDLTEMPDGTLAAIMVDTRRKEDGTPWAADRLVEITRDGTVTEIWNAWDAIDPSGLGLEVQPNWSHANGLEYIVAEDMYYLSMKSLGSIAKISGATGETQWLLNGIVNEFAFEDGADVGEMQHQFEVLGDGRMLIFDNGSANRGYSRAVELQLDEEAMTAEELWSYIRVPPLYVYAKGDVWRFPDGTTQVTWSTSGEIELVNEDQQVLWRLNAPLGQSMTFVQPFDSFYD